MFVSCHSVSRLAVGYDPRSAPREPKLTPVCCRHYRSPDALTSVSSWPRPECRSLQQAKFLDAWESVNTFFFLCKPGFKSSILCHNTESVFRINPNARSRGEGTMAFSECMCTFSATKNSTKVTCRSTNDVVASSW